MTNIITPHRRCSGVCVALAPVRTLSSATEKPVSPAAAPEPCAQPHRSRDDAVEGHAGHARVPSGRGRRREGGGDPCGLHAEIARQPRFDQAACGPRDQCARSEHRDEGSGLGLRRKAGGGGRVAARSSSRRRSEGASKGVQTHAEHVTASLADVTQWTDAAIATAQKIRAATTAAEAAPLVAELSQQTTSISNGVDANKDGRIGWQTGEGGLEQAQAHGADDERRRALRSR